MPDVHVLKWNSDTQPSIAEDTRLVSITPTVKHCEILMPKTLTVYEHPLSPYAQKVKIALREKDIPFTLELPTALGTGDVAGEFATANPRGEVPVLIDGDVQLFDSKIILDYIEDKWPNPALMPTDPAARAKVRTLQEVVDTQYEAINWGLGEVAFFKRGAGTCADGLRARAAEQTQKLQAWLTRQLGDNTWFNGDEFGFGDLVVVPYVHASVNFDIGPPSGSALGAWYTNMLDRPAVERTAAEATASIAGMEQVGDFVDQGLFKREYRDHRLEWMMRSGGVDVVIDGLAKDNIRFSTEIE